MNRLLFVYGTLKRGCRNHHHLAGQTFVGAARTAPGFRLFDLTGFPGLVSEEGAGDGVWGEVWSVDPRHLQELDEFEGVAEGIYRRVPIPLQPPFAAQNVEAYLYARAVAGRRDLGSTWVEGQSTQAAEAADPLHPDGTATVARRGPIP